MNLDDLKQGINSIWDTVAEGWQRVRQSAAGALIRFMPGEDANLPPKSAVDDDFYLPSHGWAMIGGDVFEDDQHLVIRLEIPGMEKEAFDLEVLEDTLIVGGEKRFEREQTDGRYRVLQCAYGSFRRVVPLPARVVPGQANATYANGVLKINLPKAAPGKPEKHTIKVT